MAPSGIFHLPVVAARLSNPILRKRLQAYSVFSKSIHLRCSSSSMTTLFTIPPFFCNIRKYSCTFLSISLPKSRGRPAFFFVSTTSMGGTEYCNCSFTKLQVWICFLEFSYCFCRIIHRCVFPDKKMFFVDKRSITAFAFYR